MVYDTVLIRFGELSTKGKNKKEFIRKLSKNIKNTLRDFKNLEYITSYDRIYIKINDEDEEIIKERLSNIFGISSFSFTVKVETDIDNIINTAYELVKNTDKKTFKVLTRRHDKSFEFISDTINRKVASNILINTDLKVDVHNPELKIEIEVQKEFTYITANRYVGLGGYPVGINGKVMLLLSGGIDSPVAAYYIMKRGIEIEAIHFSSPPYTSTNALNKVKKLCEIISKYQGRIRLHIVDFTDLQLAIYANVNESYAITIMRRMMLRLSEKHALYNNCLAIGTGESVGQVASQTLESMSVINDVVKLPVLRPLVCFDKNEIIDVSKRIGTYETSILPYQDCCTIFTPKNPIIKPKVKKAKEYEALFDFNSYIENVNINTEVIYPTSKEMDIL